jgi:aspartate kinase
MGLTVQKFGGTSLASVDRIKKVAEILELEYRTSGGVVAVVSAAAGTTNHILTMCSLLSERKRNSKNLSREYDAALCTGESLSAALLSLALQNLGIEARSFQAWQIELKTDDSYGRAVAKSLDSQKILRALEEGILPVVTGFQGVTINQDPEEANMNLSDMSLTTIGRGGSDTTAALVAAAIRAQECIIYTDVDGVYDTDPSLVPEASKLSFLSFEEMLALASAGAKVLHPRCVEIAMRYRIPIRVLSSFGSKKSEGTLITSKELIMEHPYITSCTSYKDIFKLTLSDFSSPNISQIYGLLTESQIRILQAIAGAKESALIIELEDKEECIKLLDERKIKYEINSDVALLSMIGYGIKNDPKLINKILQRLEEERIEVSGIHITEIKISIMIRDDLITKALRICRSITNT